MSVSYIPQNKVFAVCTFQLSASPQKFSFSRDKLSVYYQNTDQPLLTVDDKNLMEEFTCKSPWNLAGTLLAFGAGLIVGALLLSNPVGWVVAGAIAVGSLMVVGGAVATIVAATHKCTGPLKGGQWFLAHNSVKINGASAITRSSILKCKSDGVLTPFFDEASAKAAASSIASKNRWELAINVVASGFAGGLLPASILSIGAASIMGKLTVTGGRFVFGFFAFSAVNYVFRGGIRGYHETFGDSRDNVTYDQMNNHSEYITNEKGEVKKENIDKNNPVGMPSKPDDFVQDSHDLLEIKKDGPWYKITSYKKSIVLGKITNIPVTTKILVQSVELRNQLNKLEGLSRPQLRTNPLAQQLLTDLNNGKYPEWKNGIRFYNNGRMTPSMVDDGRTAIGNNVKTNFNNTLKSAGNGLLFIIPFIGTLFSEEARLDIAEGMASDMAAEPNGSSIVADHPVD